MATTDNEGSGSSGVHMLDEIAWRKRFSMKPRFTSGKQSSCLYTDPNFVGVVGTGRQAEKEWRMGKRSDGAGLLLEAVKGVGLTHARNRRYAKYPKVMN